MTMDDMEKQLEALIEGGDEQALRRFVVDHFTEFPPEAQQEFAVELFTEALENARIEQTKEDIAGAIESLEKGDA